MINTTPHPSVRFLLAIKINLTKFFINVNSCSNVKNVILC